MTAQKLFNDEVRADLTDILFKSRNKAYGAYMLRKQYDERVTKSMLITMGVFLLFFLLMTVFSISKKPHIIFSGETKVKPTVFVNPNLPPPPPPSQAKAKIIPPTSGAHNVKVVKQTVQPDSDKVKAKTPDIKLALGPTSPGDVPEPPSSGTVDAPPSLPAPTVNNPVFAPDVEPQFPGGADALDRYIKKHIHIPEIAKNGKVQISFVIDVDGRVKNVKVLEDKMGYGCAQDAVDVIKHMPLWTPGMNNGQVVPVQMTQPIDYDIEDESDR